VKNFLTVHFKTYTLGPYMVSCYANMQNDTRTFSRTPPYVRIRNVSKCYGIDLSYAAAGPWVYQKSIKWRAQFSVPAVFLLSALRWTLRVVFIT